VAGILQALGESDHLADVIGGSREDVRRQDVDRGLVGMEGGLVRGGDRPDRLRFEPCLDEHRILAAIEPLVAEVAHVGHVLDVQHLEAVVERHPSDQVGEDEAAEVPDVGVAVDGRAAGVHPEMAGLERFDRFETPGQGVVEAEHRALVICWSDHPRAADRSPRNFVARRP
jgi:hypothetical protein